MNNCLFKLSFTCSACDKGTAMLIHYPNAQKTVHRGIFDICDVCGHVEQRKLWYYIQEEEYIF